MRPRNCDGLPTTLSQQGVAVVYISHRLEEIFEIADRVTVIRDGGHISTKPIGEVTSDGLIAEMVGREVGNYFNKAASTATDEVVLSVDALTVDGVFEDVSFDLHRGEVMCMAGLVGARRTDVGLAIFGVTPATGGSLTLKGKPVKFTKPKQAMKAGIAYVSEDRRKLGLALPMSIRANVTVATLDDFLSPMGLLDRGKEVGVARSLS